jgi:hypothetical protein
VKRGDDPGRHGAADAERIADRHHPVADPSAGGVAEAHERQVGGVDLEQREVGRGVAADQTRFIFLAVGSVTVIESTVAPVPGGAITWLLVTT